MRDQLVHRQQNKIRAVVHVERPHAVHRRARGHAHHRFLRQRRVEHSLTAVLLVQAFRGTEHAAGIINALTEDEEVRIRFKRDIQRFADRCDVPEHAAFARIGRIVHK